LKTQSEGERREKGKEVGSTSIPFSHSPLIGYFNLRNSIGLNLNILFILPFCCFSSFYYVLDIGLYRANMPLDEECMCIHRSSAFILG
jgi:hypothetical protein